MQAWQIVFYISCFAIFYNYAGYAVIIFIWNKLAGSKKAPPLVTQNLPTVSFIVAAYNEEDFIEKKIQNSLAQQYPAELTEFIFITDGSTDNTQQIISRYPRIRLLHQDARKGKSAAVNRAVEAAKNDILIFSDANTFLNQEATLKIARHYSDPQIGGVAGEKKVVALTESENAVSKGEGLYWKYESFLKKIDSAFYSVVGAAGELFSVRKSLYDPIPGNVILDDFIISLKTAEKGFRIVYEPEAFAMESPSFSLKDEQKRKIRISAGGFQSILMLKSLFKFWKHPRLSFLYISHRVLRWTLSPLCLILAFISNSLLALYTDSIAFKIFFFAQLAFYLMALVAKLEWGGKGMKFIKIPYYFTFMNISVIQGFFRFLRGKQSSIWEKAKRTT